MRGFDFRVYKRAALMRRFQKRLEAVGVDGFDAYLDYLEVHPDEFSHLFNTILINVTSFFRDGASWTFLQDEIIPQLLARKGPDDPLRVWTAGCASGEETYTIAMILAEALGPEAFSGRVKIYASDVDDDALASARTGAYEPERVEGIPGELKAKYFDQQRDRLVFKSDYRRAIIFGKHNVVHDAPISRLDLLICRNVLMYFNAETQSQILARFNFALGEGGYLFLGRAEMLVTHNGLFTPVNLRHRIFTRTARGARDRMLVLSPREPDGARISPPDRLRDATIEHSPMAVLAVDLAGVLVIANVRARSLFGLTLRDVGRPYSELNLHAPVDLRPLIQAAYGDGLPVMVSGVERKRGADSQQLRVHVQPVRDEDGTPEGAIITFEELTQQHRLQVELDRAQVQLEAANEELQSTTGELETTNEELQSSNEELETTNEELQSANEELETMNEELQSTNEELQAINEELRQRRDEAERATRFVESILGGLRSGVIVVDNNLNVLNWSPRAEDLWGLRAEEVQGQSLMGLDIGLPLDQLRQPMRSVLAGDGPRETLLMEATSRRGKQIHCRVTLSPLVGDGGGRDGVIILMEEWDPRAERP